MQTRFLSLVLAFLVLSGLCLAAVPDSISYQGKLTTSTGAPVSDGTHQVQFKLYTAATGGTAFWTSEVINVQTAGGVFSTQIGPLAVASLADKAEVYLEVLAGNPFAALTPRVKFLTVPYALQASALQLSAGAASGKVLTSDASGNGVWQPATTYTAGSGLTLNDAQFSISTEGALTGQVLTCSGSSVVWGNPLASGLVLPYAASQANPGSLLTLANTGGGRAGYFITWGVGQAVCSETSGSGAAVQGVSYGTGYAGHFYATSASNNSPALVASTGGIGPACQFDVTNGANSKEAVAATTYGTGVAARFVIKSTTSTAPVIIANSDGLGPAIEGDITNHSSTSPAIAATSWGEGTAGIVKIDNTSNTSEALRAETNGSGPAIRAQAGTGLAGEFVGKTKTTDLQVTSGAAAGKVLASDASGNATWQQVGVGSISTSGASSGQALMYNGTAATWGNPEAASLALPYSDTVSSSSTALDITNSGGASAARFKISNTSNSTGAVVIEQNGTGDGMNINCTNTASSASGIYIAKNGTGAAIAPSALGTGMAISAYTRDGSIGSFSVDSSTNANTALTLTHKGTGTGAKFTINNTANNNAALYAETNGMGNAIQGSVVGDKSSAGFFTIPSTTSTKDTLVAFNSGSGAALRGSAFGSGLALWAWTNSAAGAGGRFEISNTSNPNTALYSSTNGGGYAFEGYTTGTGKGGYFHINNSSSGAHGITVETNGLGDAGNFRIANGSNTSTAVYAETNGTGPAVLGFTSGSGYGLRGETTGNAWAGYFLGRGASSKGVYISVPSGNTGLQVASGTKNAVVATSDGARLMYTEESSEVWFTDYGFGKLENGRVTITIDPKFAETVTLSEPYHVFVQVDDPECEGVAVTNKTAGSFDVVELRHGTSNAEFSYRIVAKRRGYETDRMKRAPSADNDPNLFPGR